MLDGNLFKNEYSTLTKDKNGVTSDTQVLKESFQEKSCEMDPQEKKQVISYLFSEIMKVMGLDLEDDSLKGTPDRVARMYIDEVFSGLNPKNKPKISLFENSYAYHGPVMVRDITFYSNCEHHFVPFFGKVHVAYQASNKVIGLSKINRLVKYYASRLQVQERLTQQIAQEFKEVLDTQDIAIMIEAKHLCVASRGASDDSSYTITSYYSGIFEDQHKIAEFHRYIQSKNQ